MKIKPYEITIAEITKGYINNDEDGVLGYDGKLNIRPKYQREFVYKDKQRNAVIETVRQNFPLNVIYWAQNSDDTYEVMDGQQRIISICEYVAGNFSLNYQAFHNLTSAEQQQILDYKLQVYICEGEDKEKLNWFETINIAGEKLTDQELKNAIYTGIWLTKAKQYFSKTGCPAYGIASDYMKGSPIRQDYLETVLDWISNGQILEYMSQHQHDTDANDLWLYFQKVIAWVKVTFPTYRKEMKGIPFGLLYNQYGNIKIDVKQLENEISQLMRDEDVTKKPGIYQYVLNRDEKHLSIRAFSANQKRESYENQNGKCVICAKECDIDEMEADHITPWSQGGKTISSNCQMLCKACNRKKSAI